MAWHTRLAGGEMSGQWRVGDDAVTVSARPDSTRPDGFTITIGEQCLAVTARVAPDGAYMITMPDGRQVVAAVSRDPSSAGSRWVTVADRTSVVQEADLGVSGEDEAGALEAPMPGKVLSVAVAEGDVVKAGAVLLVVEAMKMEHALRAPSDGTVVEVRAQEGDMVSPGSPLIGFEAAP